MLSLKIFGLQRTSTNYTHLLIHNNFSGVELLGNELSHKHRVPNKAAVTRLSEGRMVAVCLVKEPYSWMVSRFRLAGSARASDVVAAKRYLDDYNAVNAAFVSLCDTYPSHTLLINYEGYLTNTEGVLASIQTKFGLSPMHEEYWTAQFRTRKYPELDKKAPFDPGYYLDKRYLEDLDRCVMDVLEGGLDRELLSRLGY